jgi:hypothetical protein
MAVLVRSFLGQNCSNYAARFPIGPRAPAGIVLVDGGISQLDDAGVSWDEMEQRLTPPRLAGTLLSEFQPRLEAWFAEWGGSEQAVSITLGNFEIREDERIYPKLTFERHMRIVRSIWDFKTYAYFARVRCPTLMIPARPKELDSPPEQAYLQAKERGVAHAQKTIKKLQVAWMPDTILTAIAAPGELTDLIAGFAAS